MSSNDPVISVQVTSSDDSNVVGIVFGVLAGLVALGLFIFWIWKKIHRENYAEVVRYQNLALAPRHDPLYSMVDTGGVSGHYHSLSNPLYREPPVHVGPPTAYRNLSPFL